MKYFLDTEFIETIGNIELISIGIVAEDGREYYKISNEYNYYKADEWVRQNVIIPLYISTIHGDARNHFNAESFHKTNGRPIAQIADEVKSFIGDDKEIEFYGYYADYDWVVFCWLFGRMIDLPNGFPMYCKDLKQMMDERKLTKEWKQKYCPDPANEHNALADAKWNKLLYDAIQTYEPIFLESKEEAGDDHEK